MITDHKGIKHRVVAIGRVFKDYEEITLKLEEMYPYVDKIYIAEGRTAHNQDDIDHDTTAIDEFNDPLDKIEILNHEGPWKTNKQSMDELWDKCQVGDIVYVFGSDEYLSKWSWEAVLRQFAGGIYAKYHMGATRVNVPLYDLWKDFTWRRKKAFQFHTRFVLKQEGTYFRNHFAIEPKRLVDSRMVHMHEFDKYKTAIYHTCWTKSKEHLIKRSKQYLKRDMNLTDIPDLKKANYPGCHVWLGEYLSESFDGCEKFDISLLPEILKKHSKYNFRYGVKPPQIKKYQPQKIVFTKKVLFLCENDWAGVADKLSDAINQYTNWSSNVVYKNINPLASHNNSIQETPGNKPKIRELIKNASVIIWGSSFDRYRPFNIEIPQNCLKGIWHGGTAYRTGFNHYNNKVHPNMDFVFAHRDLEGLGKGIIRLHAPYDVKSFSISKKSEEHILIGHSPSIRSRKGTDKFLSAMDTLKAKYCDKIQMVLLEKMDNAQCVQMKKQLHIFFDQIAGYAIPPQGNHGYGVSLLESASYGSVCLSGCDYKDTPILSVLNENDIIKKCSELIDDPVLLQSLSEQTRDWVLNEHGYESVSNKFTAFLDIKINKFHPDFLFLTDVFHIRGPFQEFQWKGNNLLRVKDIPPIQTGNNLNSGRVKKLKSYNEFITISESCGIKAQKHIFRSKKPFSIFHNYPSYVFSSDTKRNEIVFIDNSGVSYNNYNTIKNNLVKVQKTTGINVTFISTHFYKESIKIFRYSGIKLVKLSDYDYNSRYGIFVDAISHDGYNDELFRKFWVYISHGIIPIIHDKFYGMKQFCVSNNLNHLSYKYPKDLKNIDIYCNWNKYKFTFEYNYSKLLSILDEMIT